MNWGKTNDVDNDVIVAKKTQVAARQPNIQRTHAIIPETNSMSGSAKIGVLGSLFHNKTVQFGQNPANLETKKIFELSPDPETFQEETFHAWFL